MSPEILGVKYGADVMLSAVGYSRRQPVVKELREVPGQSQYWGEAGFSYVRAMSAY